uniref:DYW domain-containing protein n=1 Tax=Cucumis melo TaxID=3656 RepID=A0A9I9DMV1_CUCME
MNSTIYNPNRTLNSSAQPRLILSKALTSCKTPRDLKQLHASFIKTGQIQDPLTAAEVIKFCAFSSRDIDYARAIFCQMPEPNCFCWNTILRVLAETNDEHHQSEALMLFSAMLCDGRVKPNRFTFPSVLKACARASRLREGKQIHGLIVKFGFHEDEFIISSLVRMYVMCAVIEDAYSLFSKNVVDFDGSCQMELDKRKQDGNVVLWNIMIDGQVRLGDIKSAKNLFDEMPQRSVVSWNVMISGYAQNGHFIEAINLFQEMQSSNIDPNYVTLVSVLPAIARIGALELGKWIHLYAGKNKIEIDDVLGSALVDMYSKCGSIEKALQVFETLPKRNAITWSAIIGAFAMHGRAEDAIIHFHLLGKAGVTPNDVAYIGILSACSHAGLVEEGRSFFSHMVKVVGLQPKIEHYGCMVDLLGRAGHLEEAEELIRNMPIEPDDVIWKALLGACKMHKNLKMGERVAETLMELAPHDSGSYVALSNLYASLGNWEAVARVRLKMKEMDIRKDPGCSWIEIHGIIHEFLAEDDSHSQAKEIQAMLGEMSMKLRLNGYRPNTLDVFLNTDEQEKARALQYHSEKIAVAFGLISTAPKHPLKIVKNLQTFHFNKKVITKRSLKGAVVELESEILAFSYVSRPKMLKRIIGEA